MTNLRRKPTLIALIFLITTILGAQQNAGEFENNVITIGKSYSIHSTALGEDRPYLVYLPDDYDPLGDPITVMVLLDGQGHFHHTTGIVSFLKNQGRIPDMMVVAVPNTADRTHDLTPMIEKDTSAKTGFPTGGGADQMLAFLKDELIPIIDSTYHTNAYRILVGHSFGGIFSVNALMKEPELFDAHISISPSMWWDNQNLVDKAKDFLASRDTLDLFYYMTMGNEGGRMLGGAMKLAALFEEKTPQGFQWDFKVLEEETHGSIPHRSTYDGLEAIFKDWYKADLSELYLVGGLPAIDRYFRSISQKFCYDMSPDESQINRLGYDLMSKEAYSSALDVFLENVRRFPESSNVYDSAGEAYMEMEQKDKAIEYYKKSLALNPGNVNGVAMLEKLGIAYDPMEYEIKMTQSQLQNITGIFNSAETGQVEISLSDASLKVDAPGMPIQNHHAFPDNIFLLKPANVKLSFLYDSHGTITGLEVETGIGRKAKLVKIK